MGQYVSFQSVDKGWIMNSLIELFPICQKNGFPFWLPCTKLAFHLFDALVAREDGRSPISNQVWVTGLVVIWEFLSKIYFVISDSRQYYTLVEQKAILLIFISIIDININLSSQWNWQKNQFELIKISIDSSIYSYIRVYLDIEKNINW